jgi:DNA-binding XRE family transcriptional regulator
MSVTDIPEWRVLLERAVAATSKQAVADRLDVSRTAVSQICSDTYPARTDKFAVKVMAVFGRVECPYLGVEITRAQCREFHGCRAPTSSPREMRHWRACQGCEIGARLKGATS